MKNKKNMATPHSCLFFLVLIKLLDIYSMLIHSNFSNNVFFAFRETTTTKNQDMPLHFDL